MGNQWLLSLFITYLKVEKRASMHTTDAYQADLNQLLYYLSSLAIPKHVTEVTPLDLRGWLISLAKEAYNNRSINRKIVAVRAFYAFLHKNAYIAALPTHQLKSLKAPKRLPLFFQEREFLTFLTGHSFSTTFAGMRDRLILELLYGTGMRLAELVTLRTADLNLMDGMLKVIGKRKKERLIPFPKPLTKLLASYLAEKETSGYTTTPLLIVTDKGTPCYPMFIYRIIKKYLAPTIRASQHSPHVLRHSFATHLLDKGADLNAIKALLGHASLAATQVYTHTSLHKLKEVFQQAHPRAEDNST
ncbi:tyrosine-type recombinase/integrase [Candidatus Cardinium hertigii]|uniref:Tyrosine recombinase XerD n=1 Tax=Candidatus Cardinium hertigii TaxID=247481 RepID=A0A2Z3LIB0_9BACT|nr:tyrosine-type recombinase/integrase [Candidatus Cardinium hertigii]AWN82265.1 Tyrosine recombinase XerD [Candidatus Cardinium hertigii]